MGTGGEQIRLREGPGVSWGERGRRGRELRGRPPPSPAGSVALGPGFAARAVAVHDLGARPGLAVPAAPRALAPVSRPPSRAGSSGTSRYSGHPLCLMSGDPGSVLTTDRGAPATPPAARPGSRFPGAFRQTSPHENRRRRLWGGGGAPPRLPEPPGAHPRSRAGWFPAWGPRETGFSADAGVSRLSLSSAEEPKENLRGNSET